MRRVDQAELLEVRHHVADRGRRQRHRDQSRNVARADGFAGREITLDDLTKNLPRALVELSEPGIRSDQADRIVMSHWHSLQLALICPCPGADTSTHYVNRRESPCRCRSPPLKARRDSLFPE